MASSVITKHESNEFQDVSGGVPIYGYDEWVIEQMGCNNSAEVSRMLDQYDVADYYDGGKHVGPDCHGVSVFETFDEMEAYVNSIRE